MRRLLGRKSTSVSAYSEYYSVLDIEGPYLCFFCSLPAAARTEFALAEMAGTDLSAMVAPTGRPGFGGEQQIQANF